MMKYTVLICCDCQIKFFNSDKCPMCQKISGIKLPNLVSAPSKTSNSKYEPYLIPLPPTISDDSCLIKTYKNDADRI